MEANAWTKSVCTVVAPECNAIRHVGPYPWSRSLPTTYSNVSAAKNMAARNDALITASTGNIFNTEQVMQIIFPLFVIVHICLHFKVNMIFGFSAPLMIQNEQSCLGHSHTVVNSN